MVAIWWFSLRAPTADKEIVSLGKVNIPVEVSRTPTEWGQGLSGRKSLPAGEGMLFVFPAPAIQEFWMPDMHFPLDIVWITGGQVVGIEANVSNDFDPQHPKYYHSPVPVEYVLELNAGFMAKNGLKVGTEVKI